jgi:hypothetical protein
MDDVADFTQQVAVSGVRRSRPSGPIGIYRQIYYFTRSDQTKGITLPRWGPYEPS